MLGFLAQRLVVSVAVLAAAARSGSTSDTSHETNSNPGAAPASPDAMRNSRTLLFRGQLLDTPPGVVAIGPNALLIGTCSVEIPDDVVVEFDAEGRAIFTLDPEAAPRSFTLTFGGKQIVASPTARIVVPFLGLGEAHVEWSQLAYPIPAPREQLGSAHDLRDPFDASPFH